MYHIIYKITNLLNDKIYVGKQSYNTEVEYNNYFGGGKIIIRALKKHGVENFKKEILWFCSSSKGAYILESLIVNYEFILREDTYNLVPGGRGGTGKKHTDITKKKLSKATSGKNNPMYNTLGGFINKKHSSATKKKMSESHKKLIKSDLHIQNLQGVNLGKKHTKKTLLKRENSYMCKYGVKNPSSIKNKLVLYNGITKSAYEWSKEKKIKYTLIGFYAHNNINEWRYM